ncbi:MAG: PQQ-binding-like beta-propeller repeat protein [Candidatus Latescibacterota bacterium]
MRGKRSGEGASASRRLHGVVFGLGLASGLGVASGPAAGQQAGEDVWVLDAARSRIRRLDVATGVLGQGFATPVFSRPEGACGLAGSGYSLYFVDATDPDQLIYEVSPRDGALWNAFPAPAPTLDGLAFAAGRLYAASFAEDRVYVLDAVHGTALDTLSVEADLAGGLAAGEGQVYATGLRPGRVYVVDAASGAPSDTVELSVEMPVGLAYRGGELLVGDLEGERVLAVDPQSGALQQEWPLPGVRPAGMAAAAAAGPPPYGLRLEVLGQEQLGTGQVEFALRASLQDSGGAVLRRNDRTPVELALVAGSGTWQGPATPSLQAGQAEVRLRLPLGGAAQVQARIRGLDTATVSLRAAARAANLELSALPEAQDTMLLRLEARLLDPFGAAATQDTGSCFFAVVRGPGVVVGPTPATPEQGTAVTWVRLVGRRTQVVLRVWQGAAAAEVRLEAAPAVAGAAPSRGLAVSGAPAAGGDERPPEPPGPIRLLDGEAQVEVRWEPSPTEAEVQWVPAGGLVYRRALLTGYRILRQHDDSLFVEVGAVDPGVGSFAEPRPAAPGTYRYKVLAEDGENLSEAVILPGSAQDRERTLVVSLGVPVDASGEPVLGLFGEDLVVDFEDFFLFADHFGTGSGDAGFEAPYDLDGSGLVDFDDFFIFVDYFGRAAVGYR